MHPINTIRLREYIQWFRDNVPEDQFSFNHFKITVDRFKRYNDHDVELMNRVNGNTCGTLGCIIGHIDEWNKKIQLPYKAQPCADSVEEVAMTCSQQDYEEVAFKEFGIGRHYFNIFMPAQQDYIHEELPTCTAEASKDRVIAMILMFCDLADAGKIDLSLNKPIEPY